MLRSRRFVEEGEVTRGKNKCLKMLKMNLNAYFLKASLTFFLYFNVSIFRARIICEDSELQMERIKSESGVDVTVPLSDA